MNSNQPTTLDYITLVIAVLGFGLAVASLAWQVVQFILTGPRINVRTIFSASKGNVMGVLTRNVGRMAVDVIWVGLQPLERYEPSEVWQLVLKGPQLPHTLKPGQEATWIVPIPDEQRLHEQLQGARGFADLGTGKRAVARRGQHR